MLKYNDLAQNYVMFASSYLSSQYVITISVPPRLNNL